MIAIQAPTKYQTWPATPMLALTTAMDVYHLIQQDPVHIDLSAHPTALSIPENLQCLCVHLVQYGAVEYLDLSNMAAGAAEVLEQITRAVKADGATQLAELRLRAAQVSATQLEPLLAALQAHAPLLTSLDVSENALGDQAVSFIVRWLPVTLRCLRVSEDGLSASAVTKLVEGIATAQMTNLTVLELSENRLDLTACNSLQRLLTSTTAMKSLTTLRLAHCGLDDANAAGLAEALHMSSVEILDLSRNEKVLISFILPTDPARLVSFPVSLRALCLVGVSCPRSLVAGFAQSLRGCRPNLEKLYLSKTFSGDAALSAFLGAVGRLPALRVLDLSRCSLTYRSGKVLSQLLPVDAQLEELRLDDNMLEVEGVMDFASGLERMCRLRYLDLGSCYLGNCGAVAVVTSLLRGCAPVEHLDLSNNGINDAGFRDLCTFFSRLTCPKLQCLNLSRNVCTTRTQANLMDMMQGRQSSCHVVADETPLEVVASNSCSSFGTLSSAMDSGMNSLVE